MYIYMSTYILNNLSQDVLWLKGLAVRGFVGFVSHIFRVKAITSDPKSRKLHNKPTDKATKTDKVEPHTDYRSNRYYQ